MSKPYIGITGFKTKEQIEAVLNGLSPADRSFFIKNDYQLMLGVTASDKRLNDVMSEGKTSPRIGEIENMFEAVFAGRNQVVSSFCLPMIHYFTSVPQMLYDEVCKLFQSGTVGWLYKQNLCKAIQINQDWPSVGSLQSIKYALPELQIVVQLSPNALTASDESIIERASHYANLASHILIDPSGGNAKQLDLTRGVKLLNRLKQVLPNLHIGAAGGFGPDNIDSAVQQLGSGAYKKFCVDAQGKLRTEDQLDPAKANNYITEAISGFAKLV